MGAFIVKQPNGKYCRFSTMVECPTHWNMTKDDYIELCKERAEKEAIDILENLLYPFEMIKKEYSSLNMPREEFEKILKEMES